MPVGSDFATSNAAMTLGIRRDYASWWAVEW